MVASKACTNSRKASSLWREAGRTSILGLQNWSDAFLGARYPSWRSWQWDLMPRLVPGAFVGGTWPWDFGGHFGNLGPPLGCVERNSAISPQKIEKTDFRVSFFLTDSSERLVFSQQRRLLRVTKHRCTCSKECDPLKTRTKAGGTQLLIYDGLYGFRLPWGPSSSEPGIEPLPWISFNASSKLVQTARVSHPNGMAYLYLWEAKKKASVAEARRELCCESSPCRMFKTGTHLIRLEESNHIRKPRPPTGVREVAAL